MSEFTPISKEAFFRREPAQLIRTTDCIELARKVSGFELSTEALINRYCCSPRFAELSRNGLKTRKLFGDLAELAVNIAVTSSLANHSPNQGVKELLRTLPQEMRNNTFYDPFSGAIEVNNSSRRNDGYIEMDGLHCLNGNNSVVVIEVKTGLKEFQIEQAVSQVRIDRLSRCLSGFDWFEYLLVVPQELIIDNYVELEYFVKKGGVIGRIPVTKEDLRLSVETIKHNHY